MDLLKQIQIMRKQLEESEGYVLQFNETIVDTFTHFLIWDDKHMMLYAITQNVEIESQRQYPFRIKSIDYGYLERVSSLFSDRKGSDV